MTTDERALRFYNLAWSVLQTNGRLMVFGSTKILVFRRGPLTIRYWPKQDLLDVWRRSKVRTVERCEDDPDVVHYTPGNWEDELETAAKVSAEMRKAPMSNVNNSDGRSRKTLA